MLVVHLSSEESQFLGSARRLDLVFPRPAATLIASITVPRHLVAISIHTRQECSHLLFASRLSGGSFEVTWEPPLSNSRFVSAATFAHCFANSSSSKQFRATTHRLHTLNLSTNTLTCRSNCIH